MGLLRPSDQIASGEGGPHFFDLRVWVQSVRSVVMSAEMSDALSKLNGKVFAGQLRTPFTVRVDGASPITLQLSEVNEPPTPPDIELFSLIFKGPLSPRLNQQIHHLEHAVLGKMDLFLTAVGADQQSISYESVFHRLRKAAK